MADGRVNNGAKKGEYRGQGRKPKSTELQLISKLDNIINSDDAIRKMKELINEGNFPALKLYMEYRFGKPKEVIENINRNFDAGKLTEEEVKMLKTTIESEY